MAKTITIPKGADYIQFWKDAVQKKRSIVSRYKGVSFADRKSRIVVRRNKSAGTTPRWRADTRIYNQKVKYFPFTAAGEMQASIYYLTQKYKIPEVETIIQKADYISDRQKELLVEDIHQFIIQLVEK